MLKSLDFFKGWQFKTHSFKTTNPPRLTLGWSHWRLTLQTGQQFATLLQLQMSFSAGTTNALMKLWQVNTEQLFRRHWVFSQVNIFLAFGALVFPFWMSFPKGIDRTKPSTETPVSACLRYFWLYQKNFRLCHLGNTLATAFHVLWVKDDAPDLPKREDTEPWSQERRVLVRGPRDRSPDKCSWWDITEETGKEGKGGASVFSALLCKESNRRVVV